MVAIAKITLPIPFPLRTVNCFFINGPVPTLIDTGINTPQARRRLQAELQRLGSSVDQIRRIFITHGHMDHAGMAGWISKRTRAEVFITAWDYPKLALPHQAGAQSMLARYNRFVTSAGLTEPVISRLLVRLLQRRRRLVSPLPSATFIDSGDEIDCNGLLFRIMVTSGHTPGSICLYAPKEEILFSGDTLLKPITPTPVFELDTPVFSGIYPSLRQYSQSLIDLKEIAVNHIYPGHGKCFGGHFERITQIQNHIRKRRQQVLNIVNRIAKEKGVLLIHIVERLFPKLKKNQILLGLSGAYIYLDDLNKAGRIALKMNRNKIYYHGIS